MPFVPCMVWEGSVCLCCKKLLSCCIRHPSLFFWNKLRKIRWMPMQSDRFMDGELLLERFAFRLASATFGWSRTDWKAAGMARRPFRMPKNRFKGRHSSSSSERLKQGNTKLYGTCLRRDDRNLKQLTEGVWKSMWCFGGLVDEVEIRVWQSGGLWGFFSVTLSHLL